jgi:DNA modification methylase
MNLKQSMIPAGNNSLSLQIEEMTISAIKLNTRSPRVHPEKQVAMLARNIDTFGFLVPCLIDENNRLLTGGARVSAAERLGMKSIPVIRVGHLTETEKRAFIIADAKLTELGSWEPEVLRSELQFLTDLDIDFDFSVIGFETAEVDVILESALDSPEDDALPAATPDQPAVSRRGDLWLAGRHRILCDDALAPGSYETLLGSERARLVFGDFPYNVRISGHAGGAGAVQHREFAMASGEMTTEQFQSFLENVTANLTKYSIDGSLHYLCMDWRHTQDILSAGAKTYSELKNICVWRKTNAGMGSLYRSQHELIFVFKNGTAPHINNINLGVHGRNRSNVWDYGGINSFGKHRAELLAMHPTVKPVALVADVIKDASARGDLVLDPMSGSGTVVIASQKTGRRAAVMEIDPLYVDSIVRRWHAFTGEEAVCASTKETFAAREAAAQPPDGATAGVAADEGVRA